VSREQRESIVAMTTWPIAHAKGRTRTLKSCKENPKAVEKNGADDLRLRQGHLLIHLPHGLI
jgi:hypothetical protein